MILHILGTYIPLVMYQVLQTLKVGKPEEIRRYDTFEQV